MSVNKYASLRYKIIDRLIGNKYKKYPSKEDLRQACEEAIYGSVLGDHISESTIGKDLLFLKMEYDAPIKYSKANDGYYYDEEGFSIDLNFEQEEAIKMAAKVLQQFKDVPVLSEFQSAISKILDRVNISPNMQDDAIEKYVEFEQVPTSVGNEHLSLILQAIKEKTQIEIDYQKFLSVESKIRSINPYLLKEYRNRWYVVGFDVVDGFVKTYSLDRIKKVELTNVSFSVSQSFNPEQYFDHTIGISTGADKPETVQLLLTPLEGHYAKTQPWHKSQQVISDTEEGCVIELNVFVTNELVMQILSIGENITVMEPESLRSIIMERQRKALGNYKA